jgi:hypothetical protein
MKVALRGQFYTRRAIYFRTLYESTSVLPEVHVRVQYDVVLSRKYFRTKVTTYCTCTRTRTVRVQYNVFHKVHIYRDKILSYESTLSTSVQYNVVHVHARESHVYNVVVYCTCTSEVRKYFRTFVLSYFRTVLPYLYFRTSVLPYFRTSVHVRTEVTRVFVLPYSMTDRADQIKYTYTWLISCNNLSRA